MALPPLSVGAVHDASRLVLAGVRVRPVGLPGTVALVRPVPLSDQSPVPSALVARTCAW